MSMSGIAGRRRRERSFGLRARVAMATKRERTHGDGERDHDGVLVTGLVRVLLATSSTRCWERAPMAVVEATHGGVGLMGSSGEHKRI